MKGWIFLGVTVILLTEAAPLYAETVESPTEMYQVYHKALRLLEMKEIRARWLPEETIAGNEEALTKEILRLRQVSPPEIEVKSERIIGDDAFLTVVGTYPNGGKSEGKIYLLKTVDRWKVREEKWGLIDVPLPLPLPKGEGVIEGVVTLPPVDHEGSLYIFTVLKNQDRPTAFTIIPKEKVVWKSVPYRIGNLPAGTYWVYAYWDTAPPYMDPEKKDFSVFTGDYAGEFMTTVTLSQGETRDRIDFSCSRTLKAKEEENYGTVYSLVDLGISTGADGKPVFLLSVRNNGDQPVKNISLICKINGKELTYAASSSGPLILPNEVREFDITTCYDSYLFFLEKVWSEEPLSKNQLKFEILSKDNSSRLNKEIVIQ